jgi:hypothetical protein
MPDDCAQGKRGNSLVLAARSQTKKTSQITCFATRTGRPLGHLENVG